ncbi:MAG: DUF3565 domain-containing protein [Pseudomonas sp.]|nr:DUF3565 domain-containing protein [Pseudomonas sp.]
MGQNLLRKNKERTSLTKASTESEPSADQRMQLCPDTALLTCHATDSIRLLDFHQDAQGHWVASLSCGHTQHLRHQPPWQNRPWVLAAEQRQARLGKAFPCGWCRQRAADSTLNEND